MPALLLLLKLPLTLRLVLLELPAPAVDDDAVTCFSGTGEKEARSMLPLPLLPATFCKPLTTAAPPVDSVGDRTINTEEEEDED